MRYSRSSRCPHPRHPRLHAVIPACASDMASERHSNSRGLAKNAGWVVVLLRTTGEVAEVRGGGGALKVTDRREKKQMADGALWTVVR